MKKVFISYANADRDFAERLAKYLNNSGIAVWWDEWEVKPGDFIADKISDGIKESGYFLIVLSPISTTRNWVKIEWTAAFNKACQKADLRIIPLYFKETEIPDIFGGFKYIDFRSEVEFNKQANYLLNFLVKDMEIKSVSKNKLEAKYIDKFENGILKDQKDAIEILLNLNTAYSINILLADLENRNELIQKETMKKLEDFISPEILPHLKRLSKSGIPTLESLACGYLLKSGDRTVLSSLYKFASSKDIKKRKYGIKGLTYYKYNSKADLLKIKEIIIDSIRHPNNEIRISALSSITKLLNEFENNKDLLIPIKYWIKSLLSARDLEVRTLADIVYSFIQKREM